MRTPTLIIRLAGLYLLVNVALFFNQIRQFKSMGVAGAMTGPVGNMTTLAVVGLLVGLVATIFAGPVARLLTFDAEPKKELDLSR